MQIIISATLQKYLFNLKNKRILADLTLTYCNGARN